MHLRQTSYCFRTVAARTTWQCRSCPHSRSCPDVCKYLRPIRWLSSILCMYRAVGTAGGLIFYRSLQLSFKESLAWRYSCASVFAWRAPWRVPILITKYGLVTASNVCIFNRRVNSVGIRHVPQVQQTMPPVQYFKQYEHWVLGEISHNSKEAFHVLFFDSSLKGLYVQLFSRSAIVASLFG